MATRLRTELATVEAIRGLAAPLRDRFDGNFPQRLLRPETIARFTADALTDRKAVYWLNALAALDMFEESLAGLTAVIEDRIDRATQEGG